MLICSASNVVFDSKPAIMTAELRIAVCRVEGRDKSLKYGPARAIGAPRAPYSPVESLPLVERYILRGVGGEAFIGCFFSCRILSGQYSNVLQRHGSVLCT